MTIRCTTSRIGSSKNVTLVCLSSCASSAGNAHVKTRRYGWEYSRTVPTKSTRGSLSNVRCSHLEPGCQSDTFSRSEYIAVIFGSISAFHSFSGVVEMYVSYTNCTLTIVISYFFATRAYIECIQGKILADTVHFQVNTVSSLTPTPGQRSLLPFTFAQTPPTPKLERPSTCKLRPLTAQIHADQGINRLHPDTFRGKVPRIAFLLLTLKNRKNV